MTLEEFAIEWKMTREAAMMYLAKYKPWDPNKPITRKRFDYCPIKIQNAHDARVLLLTPKRDFEVDFKDIYKLYGGRCGGINKLREMTRNKDFPKHIRKVKLNRCVGRLWDKKEVALFFSLKHDYTEPVRKDREIKGLNAMSIFFCTGRCHRIGEAIKIRRYHTSELYL